MAKHVDLELLQYFKGKQDTANAAKFVAIEANKRLMTNDEGTKLAGIEAGAQVNVIESIVLDNSASQNSIADKVATLGMSAYALKTDVASAVHYKGTVAKYSDLPSEGMETGDMYNVTAADAEHGVNAGDNVVWSGTAWDVLAGIVDLSGKVDKEDGKSLIADTEITRLGGIETGAQVNVIETVKVDDVALTVTDKTINIAVKDRFDAKVDKVDGSRLMTNDEGTKLAGISANANKTEVSAESFTAGTKVASISIDGTATEIKVPTVAAAAETLSATALTKVAGITINGSETEIKVPTISASASLTSGVEVGSVIIGGTETKFYVAADEFATTDDIDAMFAPKA